MKSLRQYAMPMLVAAALGLGFVGCTEDTPHNVPSDARLNAAGKDFVTATAPHTGMVYVYDKGHDRIIYSGKVDRGDTVSVDPDHDRVRVNDQTVFEKGLHTGDRHEIYFTP